MMAIRAIFNGVSFVPQQPVSLPDQTEVLLLIEQDDPTARDAHHAATREYYQAGEDTDDTAWGKATAPESDKAWDQE